MESYHNTAIVFGSLKDALLHFEYVIPMNVAGQFMGLRPSGGSAGGPVETFREASMEGYRELKDVFSQTKDLLKLYPPHLRQHPLFKRAVNMFDGLLFAYMIRSAHGEETFRRYVETLGKVANANGKVDPDHFPATVEGLRRLFGALVRDFQLSDIPVDCSRFSLGYF